MEPTDGNHKQKKKFRDILTSFFKGFGLLLTYELIEEILEETITWGITTAVSHTLSFLIVVLATQSIKVVVKVSAKSLSVILRPVIRNLVYKPGNDKVTGVTKLLNRIFKLDIPLPNESTKEVDLLENENIEKEANNMAENEQQTTSKFKTFCEKVTEFVKCNKKSITGTVASLLSCVGSGGAVQMWCVDGNIPVPYSWVIAVIVGIAIFALAELGVTGAGFETLNAYLKRVAEHKAVKEEEATKKAAEKLALETKKAAEKLAADKAAEAEEAAKQKAAAKYLEEHPELLK